MAKAKPLLAFELGVKRGAASVLKRAAAALEERVRERASETDHSLQDLAKMGHPYSAAHPKVLHDPNYTVHSQTGTLEGAIAVQIVNQYVARVGVDESQAPHAVDVIFGTKDMVARDFITGAAEEIRDQILAIFTEEIGKEVK